MTAALHDVDIDASRYLQTTQTASQASYAILLQKNIFLPSLLSINYFAHIIYVANTFIINKNKYKILDHAN